MKKKFKKTLEEKASELAVFNSKPQWNVSIPSMLRREIALTVEQIECIRKQYERHSRKLLRDECYLVSDFKRSKVGIPWYTTNHFSENLGITLFSFFCGQLFTLEKFRLSTF